jgi:hypothetical protein
VDLLTAVDSLVAHVPHIKQQAVEALEYFEEEDIPFEMNLQQAAAIRLFTVEGVIGQSLYNKINEALRSPNRLMIPPFLPYMRLFQEGLKHPNLPKWTGFAPLWRGMPGDLRSSHPVDTEFTWWGYSSTTTSLEAVCAFLGEGQATLFCISNATVGLHICRFSPFASKRLRPGVFGKFLEHKVITLKFRSSFVAKFVGEAEVLLPAGSVMKTTGFANLPGTNKIIIQVIMNTTKCRVV